MYRSLIKPEADIDRRIDPAHTLLIANTDASVSVQAADWYQARRGIGHRIDMDLGGTNVNVSSAHPIVNAVNSYRDSHRIECVIASADCPWMLNGKEFSAALASPTQVLPWQAFSGSGRWGDRLPTKSAWGGGSYMRPSAYTQLENPNAPVYAPDGKGRYVIDDIDNWHLKQNSLNRYSPVAHGCLGYTFSYGNPRLNTLTNIQRMVEDCIWAESQPKTSKKLQLGFGTYTADGSKEVQWYAWQIAKAAGLQTGYYRKQANLAGIDPVAWLGQFEDTTETDFFAGTGYAEGDVYLGSAVINLPTYYQGATFHNSLYPRRGAWGFNWCSGGRTFVDNLIYRGGAAGIGPMFEPYVPGLADDASILSLALKGYSLSEVAFYTSQRGWAFTAWGDPLYRPFPMLGLADGQTMQVQNTTPASAISSINPQRAASYQSPDRAALNVTPSRTATWQN